MAPFGRRGLALLLCLLGIGLFGVHRFSVGRWKGGLVMLCLTTSSILFILLMPKEIMGCDGFIRILSLISASLGYVAFAMFFVDIILIILGKFKDADGDHVTDW